jgi:two-component system, chemotaxis family, protein-glutamate methylesterase/glutaminase
VSLRALAPLLIRLAAKDVEPTVNEPSESLRHEHALSQGDGDALDHLRHFATPSTFTCPDCHGGLWRVTTEPTAARYRCHTGHAFTEHTLLNLLQEAREAALWNALRVIQEQEMLLSGATQTASVGDDAASQAATRLAEQAALLRRMLGVEPIDSGGRA